MPLPASTDDALTEGDKLPALKTEVLPAPTVVSEPPAAKAITGWKKQCTCYNKDGKKRDF